MGETTSDIEGDIDNSRQALEDNLEELEHRLRDMANWRKHVRRHPGPMMLGAVAAGMLLAAMIGKR